MAQLSLEQLEGLARDALASPSDEVRAAAMEQLRFLSAYDQWDFIKSVFLNTTNSSLLFVVAKAILFVVKHEIGPQERTDVQEFVLQYVQQNAVHLPKYLIKSIFTIYAAALFLNWRLMVVSEDDDKTAGGGSGSSALATQIEATLRRYLTPPLMLDCITEIVNHFASEDSKASALSTVRTTFSRSVLPHFFKIAEASTPLLGTQALELLCLILEAVPQRANGPLVTVNLTSDDSIYVAPGTEWMPTLRKVVTNCGEYVLTNPDPEADRTTWVCLSLLRLASCVMVGDWGGRQILREEVDHYSQELLQLSSSMLQSFQLHRRAPLLRCSLTLIVNCFERDEVAVGELFFLNPEMIQRWATVAHAACERWTDEEQECRQSILHLFYLIGVRGLPRPSSLDPLTGDGARRHSIEAAIRSVFEAYFRNVIAKCHLNEDSFELRCAEALVLHSEEHLQPLSELLFCERLELSSVVAAELRRSEEQYRACLAMRRGETIPDEMLLSLMVVSSDFIGTMCSDDISLFLTNVVLSRIAAIVTMVGLSVHTSSVFPADPLVDDVASFMRQLITPEDDVTDALLTCMSISVDCSADRGGGASPAVGRRMHLGVLRAMFHFAQCVVDSDFGRYKIIEQGIELICYVLQRHSECLPLVSDAVQLLRHYVAAGINTPMFLSSDRMLLTLRSIVDGKVGLLHPSFSSSRPSAERKARGDVLTVLAEYIEIRSAAGIPSSTWLQQLAALCGACVDQSKGDATQCFRDLNALADGCSSSGSLRILLEYIDDNSGAFIQAIKHPQFASARPDVLQLLATLGGLCCNHLTTDNVQTTQWEFASLAFNAIHYYLQSAMVGRCGNTDYYFPPNSVSESEMYDVCAWISCVCTGGWVNLGVMMLYGEDAIEGTLLLSVEALLSIPVEILVSDESRRHRVFNAIVACLEFPYPSAQLDYAASVGRVWPRLLDYLVQCLAYRFSHLVVTCIRYILLKLWPMQTSTSPHLTNRTLHAILREIAVALATTTLAEETFGLSFDVMRHCYVRDCEGCEQVLEHLLSFCSAYHRVRIRCILMMMRGGPSADTTAQSYVSVFGTTSKLATVAAW